VDDNATNRQILERILTHWRMRPAAVDEAKNALVTLKRAKENNDPFVLMIVDRQMPEIDGFTLVEQIQRSRDLAGLITVMLTSGGERGDGARCAALGIAAYLFKPVLQSDLLDALMKVFGDKTGISGGLQLMLGPRLLEGRTSLRVLLAEDNRINQRLVVRLLEKRGHTVIVAEDGAQALKALQKNVFDLVLMDVQMPIMDGLQAAAQIREREKATGAHVPIIAMTAHAMQGDRQRFLDGGMDGYVSKPVHAQELFDAIEALVPKKRSRNASENGEAEAQVTAYGAQPFA
jgi:two-component system sensor histidine kinase/response regulator